MTVNNSILLRYSEIGIKSRRKRPMFEKFFVEAIQSGLDKSGFSNFKIKNYGGRFILFSKHVDKMIKVLERIPGILSFSPAKKVEFINLDDLVSNVKDYASFFVKGKTFKIDTNRVGKHDFSSRDASIKVADSIYEVSLGVTMKDPDVTVFLEIRDNECYIFTEKFNGVGGFPPKSTGKVLCMFSGGIDSPVAAYQMLKKGFVCDFIFINMLGEKALYEASRVYNYLTSQYVFGFTPRFIEVDGQKLVEEIKNNVLDQHRQTALKVMYYKVAEAVVDKFNYDAIATGEALSQKSSQTVQSLAVINSVTDKLIIRPLISLDKTEITDMARKIGTMMSSEKVMELCNIATGPVSTKPALSILSKFPDLSKEVEDAVENCTVHKGIVKSGFEEPGQEKFSDYVTIDVRPSEISERDPIGCDLSIPFEEVVSGSDNLDKEKNYVLVCAFAVKSANAAFDLRRKGFKAIGVCQRNYDKFYKKKN